MEDLRHAAANVQEAACVSECLRSPVELDVWVLGNLDRPLGLQKPSANAEEENKGHKQWVHDLCRQQWLELGDLGFWLFQQWCALIVCCFTLAAECSVVVDLKEEDNVADGVLGSAKSIIGVVQANYSFQTEQLRQKPTECRAAS